MIKILKEYQVVLSSFQFLVFFFISGCGTFPEVAKLSSESFQRLPDNERVVLTTSDIKTQREIKEIAIIKIRAGVAASVEQLNNTLINEARKLGANAVIRIEYGSAGMYGNPTLTGTAVLLEDTTYNINAYKNQSKCLAKKDDFGSYWAREDSRTQSGGWLFFPGNAVSLNNENASIFADGRALDLLVKECHYPHQSIRFNERCVEEIEGKIHIYVRASIKESDCVSSRGLDKPDHPFVNKPLWDIFQKYLKISQENLAKTQIK